MIKKTGSSIQLLFLQKLVQQRQTVMISFCVQYKKEDVDHCSKLSGKGRVGSWLLANNGGKKKKDRPWKTKVSFCLMSFRKKTNVYYSILRSHFANTVGISNSYCLDSERSKKVGLQMVQISNGI